MASTESAAGTAAASSRRTRTAVDTCHLCTRTTGGEIIDAGGDLGRVHRDCFTEWDRLQEALEMSACAQLADHPGEFWAELEMEGSPVAEAA